MQESFREDLRGAGHRITKPRLAVLKILQQAKQPLAAPEILEKLQKTNPQINITTIYRNLSVLSKLGLTTLVGFPRDGITRYAWCAGKANHHHIRCQSCGRIAFFLQISLADFRATVERKTQFRITDESFELSGICPKCK